MREWFAAKSLDQFQRLADWLDKKGYKINGGYAEWCRMMQSYVTGHDPKGIAFYTDAKQFGGFSDINYFRERPLKYIDDLDQRDWLDDVIDNATFKKTKVGVMSKEFFTADTYEDLKRLAEWLDAKGYRASGGTTISEWIDSKIVVGNTARYKRAGDLLCMEFDNKHLCGYAEASYYRKARAKFHVTLHSGAAASKRPRTTRNPKNANAMARRMFAAPNQVKTSFRKR